MASMSGAEAVPITVTAISLTALLGHDPTFWVVVIAAAVLKMITSDPPIDAHDESTSRAIRRHFISFLSGVIPPFVATKGLAAWLEVTDPQVVLLIAVMLVITGEGLVRWLVKMSKNPEGLSKILLSIFSGGKK